MNVEKIIIKKIQSLTNREFNKNSKILEIGIDSLDLVELIIEAEKSFDISITDEELINFESVDDVIKLIKNKLKK